MNYRGREKMSVNKGIASNPIIHRAASRKGGRARVKKGFAMNPALASEAGRRGGIRKHEIRRKEGAFKEKISTGDYSPRLADLLGDIDVSKI